MWSDNSPVGFNSLAKEQRLFQTSNDSLILEIKEESFTFDALRNSSKFSYVAEKFLENTTTAVKYLTARKNINRQLTVKPHNTSQNQNCIFMLLFNFAEPKWISVSCHEFLANVIVCQLAEHVALEVKVPTLNSFTPHCAKHQVKLNGSCLEFKNRCERHSNNMESILFTTQEEKMRVHSVFSTWKITISFVSKTRKKTMCRGVKINERDMLEINQADGRNHVFRCPDESIISSSSLCDGKSDCVRDSHKTTADERNCDCSVNGETISGLFCTLQCAAPSCQCPVLFKQNERGCSPYLPNIINIQDTPKPKTVSVFCHPDSEEEFLIFQMCLFRNPQPCSNGAHLENCSHFECSAHFKCPGYYCVPWQYVCNGIWDCPVGEEEVSCQKRSCSGFFKCKKSSLCLHMSDVCDGTIDCPLKDDEMLCVLVFCHKNCTCFAFAIACEHLDEINWLSAQNYIGADIIRSHFNLHDAARYLPTAKNVALKNNDIVDITISKANQYLENLDLSSNQIEVLKKNGLIAFPNVKRVNWHNNMIFEICEGAFQKLLNLKILNVSVNFLSHLTAGMWKGITSLQLLDLEKNNIILLSYDTFASVEIKEIITDNFRICCLKKSSKCSSEANWPFSCGTLLDSKTTNLFSIIVAFITFSFNSSAFTFGLFKLRKSAQRMKTNSKSEVGACFSINAILLHTSDLFTGVHTIGLVVADYYFGETYVGFDVFWRKSIWCYVLACVSVQSNLLSQFLLVFLAYCRYDLTKKPVNSPMSDYKHVKAILLKGVFCLLAPLSAYLIVQSLLSKIQEFPLCVFLGNRGTSIGKVFSAVVATFQICSTLLVWGFYTCLACELKANQKDKVQVKSGLSVTLLVKLILVSMTNAICWIPSSITLFISIRTQHYSINLLFWTLVILIPVNSVLNPVFLYSGHVSCKKTNNKTANNQDEKNGMSFTWQDRH